LRRTIGGNPADSWGGLKEAERAKVLSALKAKFPDRYKQLVKQYHKSLQKQKRE
jgi:hypothetical protein